MSIPIEYVNRKREVSATDEDVTITFYIKVNQAWAESNENVAVLIMGSDDEQIPQVGDSLGNSLRVKERSLSQKEDRIDLYELECVCPIGFDDNDFDGNSNWGNRRVVSIDYDIVEYQVVATQGEFAGTSTLDSVSNKGTFSKADKPLFKYGALCPIQSSAGKAFDNPVMTTRHNLLIRLTQTERMRVTSSSIIDLTRHIGTINSRPLMVAGIEIPERGGLMRMAKPIPQPGGKLNASYEIEVQLNYPLYSEVLDQDYWHISGGKAIQTQNKHINKIEGVSSNSGGEDEITAPYKLDGSGGLMTDKEKAVYLLFYTNRFFVDWNRSLDLTARIR